MTSKPGKLSQSLNAGIKANKFTNNLIMQNKKIENNRNNNSVSFLNKI